MWKIFVITLILVSTTWMTGAQNSECVREELEEELREYVKLESWQQLFQRHLKFFVDTDGNILSERKRLKFNTIIHNAIYGCDHNRDDEVDDCPNIYRGSIKSCKHGKNVRAAMFRAARCVFVESSIKHLVLSDALLDAYPRNKLDKLSFYADKPIREFGETIVNILATLGHGETGGLGELMALNLYLNNKYGTVFMHKIPVEPVESPVDFIVAQKRMRAVHGMILEKLHAFWDNWCGDRDVVTQYRLKYENANYLVVLNDMDKNIRDADDLVRGLNVSDNVVDTDFDPKKIALTEFVDGVVSSRSMPDALLAEVQLRSFEASYEFNPRELYGYHAFVFRSIYTCFYWTTITQLRLAARIVDEMERYGIIEQNRMGFIVNLVKFIRPLSVFNMNRAQFVLDLSPAASDHLTRLLSYLLQLYRTLKKDYSEDVILSSKTEARTFADQLSADMVTMMNATEGLPDDFENYSYESAVKLFETNYQAFARLVSTTSDFKDDRMNLMKLKKYLFFAVDVVGFDQTD